jgi:hypothetical protein
METLDAIKARLMQRASLVGEPNVSPTFTGRLQDEESMQTLTDEIREFIVKGLARFETPSQVAEAVNETFGIAVSRQHVYRYDPKNTQPPAQRWRDLHALTREKFLRDVAEIGVSHKVVRLQMLDRLANRCERNAVALALASLELAAKECGGFYENRRPVLLQLPAQSSEPQLPEQLPHYAASSPAAETCKTISAAATIISIGSDGATLSPVSGPLPSRNNAATCSEA